MKVMKYADKVYKNTLHSGHLPPVRYAGHSHGAHSKGLAQYLEADHLGEHNLRKSAFRLHRML